MNGRFVKGGRKGWNLYARRIYNSNSNSDDKQFIQSWR